MDLLETSAYDNNPSDRCKETLARFLIEIT
jgi:hypothetical protein